MAGYICNTKPRSRILDANNNNLVIDKSVSSINITANKKIPLNAKDTSLSPADKITINSKKISIAKKQFHVYDHYKSMHKYYDNCSMEGEDEQIDIETQLYNIGQNKVITDPRGGLTTEKKYVDIADTTALELSETLKKERTAIEPIKGIPLSALSIKSSENNEKKIELDLKAIQYIRSSSPKSKEQIKKEEKANRKKQK